jgi:hypothetical protein
MRNILPMHLQLFAEPPAGNAGTGEQGDTGAASAQQTEPPKTPEIDYEKLASVIEGKKAVAEDTVLKNYFKKQGLSREEMENAIGAYKKQKQESEPNPDALQAQVVQAQQLAVFSEIEKEGVLLGVEMGLDVKTIPYVMKLADTSAVVAEGKVDADKLKEAINKVLEDVPALKSGKKEEQSHGFVQVGAGQTGSQTNTTGQQSATPVIPTKRWNRFN